MFRRFLYECRLNEKQVVETVKKYLNDVLTPDKQSLKPFYITDNYIKIFGSNYIEGEMCSPVTNIDTIFSNLKVNKGNIYAFDFDGCLIFQFHTNMFYGELRQMHIISIMRI